MAVDPPIKPDIDYIRIIADKMRNVPAWKEMAEAARQILGSEVDDRRRKLQKIRDSVKYRRNDVLVNVDYTPEADKPMVDEITGVPFIPNATSIQFRTAKVVNVIKNLSNYIQKDTVDYLDLRVSYNGRDYRWLKPFQSPQERDILLKNAYRLGFNFFNTKLSDEDLQRLVEFIQMYWNEAGTDDNFMKFIGFIKNTRFDLVALWTDGPAESPDLSTANLPAFQYPYLEARDNATKSVKDGGTNWLTSHVEIDYDLAQFNQFYTVNLDDLEQLFYYFAPIILVLERIVGKLEVDTTLLGINAVSLNSYRWDILKPATQFITEVLGLSVYGILHYEHGCVNTKQPAYSGTDSVVNLSQDYFDFRPYLLAAGII
jgi:hypothetical protein